MWAQIQHLKISAVALEVNIFDFQQTIYGQIIRVDFLKMLRREIKFTSVDALLNQMKKDVKQAKLIL